MRLDLPHIRSVESGVAYDFDVLAGQILAGQVPLVVRGFELNPTAVGRPAETLTLSVAGGTLVHYNATESGSLLRVPDDRGVETLDPLNPRMDGAWSPGLPNFVGLDFSRQADASTADLVQILRVDTGQEVPAVIPLARTLDYRIVVSTREFGATPGVLPLYVVETDAGNTVTAVKDARWLLGRLGSGGTAPDPVNPYPWPGGRSEGAGFRDGDKAIDSLKAWCNAAMTRIWEVGGGEWWYSPTADRNVHMFSNNPFTNGNGMLFSGGHLTWRGLGFTFDNSTSYLNEVQDQTAPLAGLTDIADGECVYVDLDRTQPRTVSGLNPLVAAKARLQTLGVSARPGNRWVLAWRVGANVYIRDERYVATPAAVIRVDNVAALEALDAGPYQLGQPVFVGNVTNANQPSVHATWHLENSAATVDHIEVASVTNKVGYRWVRDLTPNPKWWPQDWYVDPQNTTGVADDEGPGTQARPLRTLAEHARRIRGIKLGDSTGKILNLMSSQEIADRPNYQVTVSGGQRLFIKGTPSAAVLSGTLSGAQQVVLSGDLPSTLDYYMNNSANVAWPAPASGVDVQVFLSGGTWNKPFGALSVRTILVGGGGGGGNGRVENGLLGDGGSGGSASGVAVRDYAGSDLPSSCTVIVGVGGTGGSATLPATPTVSHDGGDGSPSVFHSGGGALECRQEGGLGGGGWNNPTTVEGSLSGYGGAGNGGRGGRGEKPEVLGTDGGAGTGYASGGGGGGGGVFIDEFSLFVRAGHRGGNSGTGILGGAGGTSVGVVGASAFGGQNGNEADHTSMNESVVGAGGGGGGGAARNSSTGPGPGGQGGRFGAGGGGGGGNTEGTPGGGAGGNGRAGVVIVITVTGSSNDDAVIFQKTNGTPAWWFGAKGLTGTRLRISVPSTLSHLNEEFFPTDYESTELALQATDTWTSHTLPKLRNLHGLESTGVLAQHVDVDGLTSMRDGWFKHCWFSTGGALAGNSKILNCAIGTFALADAMTSTDGKLVVGGGMARSATGGSTLFVSGPGEVECVGAVTCQGTALQFANVTVTGWIGSVFDAGFADVLSLVKRALVDLRALGGTGSQGNVFRVRKNCVLQIKADAGLGAAATVPPGITSAAGSPCQVDGTNQPINLAEPAPGPLAGSIVSVGMMNGIVVGP